MKTTLFICSFFLVQIVLNAQITTMQNCLGDTTGRSPESTLISDGTYLYGTSRLGGTGNIGMIFKIKPDGTGFQTIYSWTMPITGGYYPSGSLMYDGTFLYGMTINGGTNDNGTIYKIQTDGTGFQKIYDFLDTISGKDPQASLVSDGTFLYGMARLGGSVDLGTIFKIMPDGSGFMKLHDFTNIPDGAAPNGGLIYDGTYLYGMTTNGGAISANGSIFKILPDGTGYALIKSFVYATDGGSPYGSLMLDAGILYGMTTVGAANGSGSLFKIMPDGSGFDNIFDFGAGNGSNPQGEVMMDGGFLYGMTTQGGSGSGSGNIFKIRPDGSDFLVLHDFSNVGTDGSLPMGGLYSDGTHLYGTTSAGGSSNFGTIFKLQYAFAGIEQNGDEISMKVFPNPTSGTLNLVVKKEVQNATIDIMNMVGQSVMSIPGLDLLPGENYSMNISSLAKGTYLVRLGNYEKTVIKN